jgi:hypothetical protein
VGREVGTDLAVLSALVEESGRTGVGRVTIGVDPRVDADRLERALAAQGLIVEQRASASAVASGAEAVA